MQDNRIVDLRRNLEGMSSEQLSRLLQKETKKDYPDDDLVLELLHMLEEREADVSEPLKPHEEAAFAKYQYRRRSRRIRKTFGWSNLVKVASAVLVVGILAVSILPQQAAADGFWNKVARWTDDLFAFFQPEEDSFALETYEFKTDNPGLQQLYDAVVSIGITEPVVPMWLPEGYELVECFTRDAPAKQYVHARFTNGEQELVFKATLFITSEPFFINKDDRYNRTLEKNGIVYNIMQNHDAWDVIWVNKNIECFFTMDCQEEVLHNVIMSIYRWRTNE